MQEGVFTGRDFTEVFQEKTNQNSDLDQRNISSSSQGEGIYVRTIPHDTHKGLERKANLKCSCTTCTL